MKKVLFATTALIATAGVAAADVTLSGATEAIFSNSGVAGEDTVLNYAVELDVTFSGATDNGLTFGATMDIDSSSTAANNKVSDPEITISGAFGTVMLGAISHAADGIGLSDVGDGVGMDDTLEALRGTVGADVGYKYSIDGLTLTLTTKVGSNAANNPAGGGEGDFSMLVAYKMGDLGVEVGYADENESGDSFAGIELSYAMGPATLGVTMIDRDEATGSSDRDRSGFGASVGYAVNDALTVTGVYSSTEAAAAGSPDIDDYGIGFAYNLGGGAKLVGGMGEEATVDKWDFGVQLSF